MSQTFYAFRTTSGRGARGCVYLPSGTFALDIIPITSRQSGPEFEVVAMLLSGARVALVRKPSLEAAQEYVGQIAAGIGWTIEGRAHAPSSRDAGRPQE